MKLHCNFLITEIFLNFQYTCKVFKVSPTGSYEAEVFEGHHAEGKSTQDVDVLEFENASFAYIPNSLFKFLPSLSRLCVYNCELSEISSHDLFGLGNLVELEVVSNALKSLPDNLLEHTPKLRLISFKDNLLESVSSVMLDAIPVQQLNYVDFRNNRIINACYIPGEAGSLGSLQELKEAIDVQSVYSCPSSSVQTKVDTKVDFPFKTESTMNGIKKLWETKTSSDFAIIVDQKEIQVHKIILSSQSSVFASMLEDNKQVKATNKLEIKDCNEEVVHAFLRSLYTGEVENDKNALELFSLACTFKVTEMQSIYKDIAIQNLNGENALKAFKLGTLYEETEVIEAAFAEIKKMYPNDIRSEALKHNPERVEEIVKYKKQIEEYNKEN